MDARISDRLDGKLHIRRTQRLPIVPVHVLAQVKHIRIGRGVVLHRLRKRRDNVIVFIAPHQPVEQQLPDLGVLIHEHINLLVVLCRIDEPRTMRLVGAFPDAAAREREKDNRHAPKQQLLHHTSPPLTTFPFFTISEQRF